MNPTKHLAAALALFLLCACVEFEQQTILMRWDPKTDALHVRLIYEGLYAKEHSDPKERDRAEILEALEQLKTVVETETQFFLLDNWPFGFDLGPGGENEVDPIPMELAKFIRIENGTFFIEGKRKLCAWQDLRIAPATEFVAEANRLFNKLVLEAPKSDKGTIEHWDAESSRLIVDAARKGHGWWRLDERGVRFQGVLSDQDAVKLKRELLEDLGSALKKDEERDMVGERAEAISGLSRNRLSWIHEDNRITLALGADPDGFVRVHWTPNAGRYVPNLLDPFAEGEKRPELPAPVDPKTTVAQLESSFVQRFEVGKNSR